MLGSSANTPRPSLGVPVSAVDVAADLELGGDPLELERLEREVLDLRRRRQRDLEAEVEAEIEADVDVDAEAVDVDDRELLRRLEQLLLDRLVDERDLGAVFSSTEIALVSCEYLTVPVAVRSSLIL